jgi:hypothetical protein
MLPARIWRLVDRHQPNELHQAAHTVPGHIYTPAVACGEPSGVTHTTVCSGIACPLPAACCACACRAADDLHELQVPGTFANGMIVKSGPAQRQQLALPSHAQPGMVFLDAHLPSLLAWRPKARLKKSRSTHWLAGVFTPREAPVGRSWNAVCQSQPHCLSTPIRCPCQRPRPCS